MTVSRYRNSIVAFVAGVLGIPYVLFVFIFLVSGEIPSGETWVDLWKMYLEIGTWLWAIAGGIVAAIVVLPFRKLPVVLVIFISPWIVTIFQNFMASLLGIY